MKLLGFIDFFVDVRHKLDYAYISTYSVKRSILLQLYLNK